MLTLLLGCEQSPVSDEFPEEAQVVTQVAYVVLLYRKEHERLPESMEEILAYDESTPRTDNWGNEFQYEFEGDEFTIYSAGPDRQVGTEDDLRAALKATPSE